MGGGGGEDPNPGETGVDLTSKDTIDFGFYSDEKSLYKTLIDCKTDIEYQMFIN